MKWRGVKTEKGDCNLIKGPMLLKLFSNSDMCRLSIKHLQEKEITLHDSLQKKATYARTKWQVIKLKMGKTPSAVLASSQQAAASYPSSCFPRLAFNLNFLEKQMTVGPNTRKGHTHQEPVNGRTPFIPNGGEAADEDSQGGTDLRCLLSGRPHSHHTAAVLFCRQSRSHRCVEATNSRR